MIKKALPKEVKQELVKAMFEKIKERNDKGEPLPRMWAVVHDEKIGYVGIVFNIHYDCIGNDTYTMQVYYPRANKIVNYDNKTTPELVIISE